MSKVATRTASVFARVEPEVKDEAERVLNQLGIPMSNAIGLFLRQVVMQQGIPFDMKLPVRRPIDMGALTKEQFDAEIEKGFADMVTGRMRSADEVFTEIRRDYAI